MGGEEEKGTDRTVKLVELAGQVLAGELEASQWGSELRLASRVVDERRELRKSEAVGKALAKGLSESQEGKDVEDLISAVANLVVDEEQDLPGCKCLLETGAFDALGKIAQQATDAKLQTLSAIALGNLARQLDKEYEPQLTEFLTKLGESQLVRTNILLACTSQVPNVRRTGVTNVQEFCARSDTLKEMFLNLNRPEMSELVSIVSDSLLAQGRNESLQLIEMFCENSRPIGSNGLEAMKRKDAKHLYNSLAVERLVSHIAFQTKCASENDQNGRQTALKVLNHLVAASVASDGSPIVEDSECVERVQALDDVGGISGAVGFLESIIQIVSDVQVSKAEFDARVSAAQLLAYCTLALDVEQDKHREHFNAIALVVHRGVTVLSESVKAMVTRLRDTNQPLTQEEEKQLREDIHPFAFLRLNLLGLLNSLSSSPQYCHALLNVKHTDGTPCHIIQLCIDLADDSFEFDLESTRYALNIVRNLVLDASTRFQILSSLPKHRVGPVCVRIAKNSRDPNGAGLAAAILRLFAASHDAALLDLLLSPVQLEVLVSSDLNKLAPHAHVEVVRALSHMVSIVCEEGFEDLEFQKVLLTEQVLSLVSFLLQSNQAILHAEALSAMNKCSPQLLSLAKSITLKLQIQPLVKTNKPEFVDVSLVERLEQIAAHENDTTNPQRSAVATLARQVVEKIG